MANDKYLFVVSGAAGTGKDSVVKALREAHPEIEKTVSATTRAPRPGEQEGVDYYYRTREQFQELERRLRGRGTETEDSIQERLATARQELAQQDKFTLKLVNDRVDTCADALYEAICRRIGSAE